MHVCVSLCLSLCVHMYVYVYVVVVVHTSVPKQRLVEAIRWPPLSVYIYSFEAESLP